MVRQIGYRPTAPLPPAESAGSNDTQHRIEEGVEVVGPSIDKGQRPPHHLCFPRGHYTENQFNFYRRVQNDLSYVPAPVPVAAPTPVPAPTGVPTLMMRCPKPPVPVKKKRRSTRRFGMRRRKRRAVPDPAPAPPQPEPTFEPLLGSRSNPIVVPSSPEPEPEPEPSMPSAQVKAKNGLGLNKVSTELELAVGGEWVKRWPEAWCTIEVGDTHLTYAEWVEFVEGMTSDDARNGHADPNRPLSDEELKLKL